MVMVPEVIVKRRLGLEDYLALPDDQDYEIIEGVLYVAPRARALHQIVWNRLAYILTGHVEVRGLGVVVQDADLIIDDRKTYISPDTMVFLGNRLDGVNLREMLSVIPDLVVEVLSPSNDQYDLETKRDLYARLGVQHYWVADPSNHAVLEHVLQADGSYRLRRIVSPEPFTPAAFPGLRIDLPYLFR